MIISLYEIMEILCGDLRNMQFTHDDPHNHGNMQFIQFMIYSTVLFMCIILINVFFSAGKLER